MKISLVVELRKVLVILVDHHPAHHVLQIEPLPYDFLGQVDVLGDYDPLIENPNSDEGRAPVEDVHCWYVQQSSTEVHVAADPAVVRIPADDVPPVSGDYGPAHRCASLILRHGFDQRSKPVRFGQAV